MNNAAFLSRPARVSRALAILSAMALGVALAGCGAKGGSEQPPLAGARIGGPFTLTDQDGKPRSWDSFDGKYRLVYFGYTYCPDVCPMDLQKIMAGYRLFQKAHPEQAAGLQPMMISIDPERDTPAVMKAYVGNFPPNLVGLTGTPDQIAAVAKSFAVVYGREDARGPGDYLVSHSRTPYLFDPKGQPVALIPTDEPGTAADEGAPERVAEELAKWVR